jgi:hypothetical protein
MRKLNITNQRFGRLVAKSVIRKNGCSFWNCVCDCGEKTVVIVSKLRNGHTKSCGCFQTEIRKTRGTRSLTHGNSKNHLYRIWAGMLTRCNNPKGDHYKYYGGRGISVCEHWRKFENFFEDMEPSFKNGLSIDRIDNNGNYCKENCRWSTLKEQMNNMSTNHFLEHNGKRMTIAQWAVSMKTKGYVLNCRLYRG